jgi:hypothetical protein
MGLANASVSRALANTSTFAFRLISAAFPQRFRGQYLGRDLWLAQCHQDASEPVAVSCYCFESVLSPEEIRRRRESWTVTLRTNWKSVL